MNRILVSLFFLLSIPLFSQYKNQSVGFKENKGQITDQKGKPNKAVKYLLNSGGLNVQLRKNGFSYDVYEIKKHPITHSQTAKTLPYQIPEKDKLKKPNYTLEYQFHRIDIDFVDSNSKVELITHQESKDFDNYYNIPNKPEGIIGVHQYKQITYKNIYPNIDVVFTIPKDTLKTVEYNFIVHPNGKISDIQLKFSGAETNLVDNKIQMNVRFGKMEETLPASWTEEANTKKGIAVGYRKIKNGVYGFETSDLISDKTLIIDPVPIRLWGTYYGGDGGDFSSDICNDKNNNVYFSGRTRSTVNIATIGTIPESTYYTYYNGFGYVTKFNTNGVRIWGTYYSVIPYAIKADSNENLYFVGTEDIDAINVTTPNSHQPTKEQYDYSTAFLVKLNSSGIRDWGTYYGAGNFDTGNDLCFDNFNNVYLVGNTQSRSKIATSNTQQPNHSNGYLDNDGFIVKFTSQGVRVWGTYFGGIEDDRINSCNISDDGFLYVTGKTSSTNDIATPNSFQPNYTGYGAGLIAKFTLDGKRVWGSYFNGERFATITQSKIKDNFLFLIGTTDSHNNLISSNTFNANFQSSSFFLGYNYNCFIVKFDLNTQTEIWGTYFGEIIQDLEVNSKGKVIFGGCTDLKTGIATANAYKTLPEYSDAYMIKLDENGQREWGTYYGGNFQEGQNGAADVNNKISIDLLDNIYLVGNTQSSTGISTSGAHQEHYSLTASGVLQNVYLAKFQDCLSNPQASSNSPICIGNSLELKASGGTTYSWTGPNGFTSSDQNPIITNASSLYSGEYSCAITGTEGCDDTKKIDVVVGDLVAPVPDLITLPTITGDCHTTINTIPSATDACAGAVTGTTTSPLSYSLPETYTIVWNYNDGNGNSSSQNQTVIINSQPLPTITSPQTFCIQENATLANISVTGQNIKWYDALTNGNLLANTTLLQDGKTYYASQTINNCESERVPVSINIQNTPAPTGNATQIFCSDQNPTLDNIIATGQNIKWYNTATNGNILVNSTSLQNGITYYASQAINSCEGTRLAVTISIQNTPTIPTGDTNPKFCKSENATFNDINITGQNLKWYNSNTSTTPLANNTLVQNNMTYYVSQTIGCESGRLAVLVNVYDTVLPTTISPQTFCIDENATISNITISGNTIKWYDAQTAGNISGTTTTLENRTYYASQTMNNCESQRQPIVIKIQDTQPPVVNANQSFCAQQNATINTIKINGQNIKWYDTLTGGANLTESTPLQNGITYYASQTVNDCESERTPITIQIHGATTPECINFVDELPYPKFFTPNSDGYNDTWTIDFIYLKPNSTIRIFDRYGKFIKELTQYNSWDGMYLNQPLPSSDYWFLATRLNGAEFRSHFSLKR